MKKIIPCLAACFFLHTAHAQFYNDGEIMNDGGLISDWQSQWFNSSGSAFTGRNNGVFEHYGPSSQTFVNNGSYDADAGFTDRFLGPSGTPGVQEIGGTARPFFYDLQLSNGAAQPIHITNPQGVSVRSSLTFNNGITTTIRNLHSNAALRFENGASYVNGNTDAQHVDGYVTSIGTTPFTFPTGSGTDLRTLTTAARSASGEISVAWFEGNPGTVTDPSDGTTHSISSLSAPILSVSDKGFWDYVLVSGNDDALGITVSIPDLTGFALAADLRLVGWNGTQWMDLSGSANASGNAENSTLSGTIPAGTTISAIAIGSTSFPLPVEFASFNVTATANCEAVVKWSTSMELNNAWFVVERSDDGNHFTALSQIPGAGNSSTLRSYNYTDVNPAPGNNYYRIRQVDLDGRSKTTVIKNIRMQCGNTGDIRVYPTISSSGVNVLLNQAFSNAQAELFDLSGRKMPVSIQSNGMRLTVSLAKIASGQYILRLTKNSNQQTFKVVKP